MSKITVEQIHASLKEFGQELGKYNPAQAETVPAGWYTMSELADEIGISYSNARRRISFMLKEGRVEKKVFRIMLERQVRPVPHYRLR